MLHCCLLKRFLFGIQDLMPLRWTARFRNSLKNSTYVFMWPGSQPAAKPGPGCPCDCPVRPPEGSLSRSCRSSRNLAFPCASCGSEDSQGLFPLPLRLFWNLPSFTVCSLKRLMFCPSRGAVSQWSEWSPGLVPLSDSCVPCGKLGTDSSVFIWVAGVVVAPV